MLEKVATRPHDLQPYRNLVGAETLADLERLACRLGGLKAGHVNTSPRGGGVAEILMSLVPLMNGLGVKAHWYCIAAGGDFVQVTEKIQNIL